MWSFIPVLSVSNSGAARGFQNCYIFLSEKTKAWQGTFSVSLEPPMAKPIKKSHRRKAPAPREFPPAASPSAARRRVEGFAFWSGFRGSPWSPSRAEGLTAPRRRQNIARMLESRVVDPPAGFVQLQIARLSEPMIFARTMTRRAMCARWVDCSNSTATMASRSGCFASRGSLVATAHSRAATRIAGVVLGAR